MKRIRQYEENEGRKGDLIFMALEARNRIGHPERNPYLRAPERLFGGRGER